MYAALSIVSLVVFGFIFFGHKPLRKPMIWAGLLSLPLFSLKFLITPQFVGEVQSTVYWTFLAEAVVFGFCFGGIAAVIFELLFHEKLKTTPHPHRLHLNWLIFGPIVFMVLEILAPQSFGLNIVLGFLTQALILLYLRKDLLWDALLSGVFLGIFYLVFYYLFLMFVPGQTTALWFSDITGISVFGLPIEEIMAIFAFGILWGPIYEGTKGYVLRKEEE